YVVFHTVFSDEEGRYIYAVSEVERSGFSYFYSGGYSNSTNFEVVDKPYMGDVSIYKTEIGRMVAGIYVGEEPDRIEVNGIAMEVIQAGETDVYYWSGVVEYDEDLTVTVVGSDGEILDSMEIEVEKNIFEIIAAKRDLSADDIKKRNVSVTKTELGMLVNYWREDEKAIVSEWLEYSKDGLVFMGYAENPVSLISEDNSSVVVFNRFIFGITKADVENVKITKGLLYSSNPLAAETIQMEDDVVLWYQILTDEFMDRQEVVIEKRDGSFFVVGSEFQQSSKEEEQVEQPISNFDGFNILDFAEKFMEAERIKDFAYLKSVSTEEFYIKLENEDVLLDENIMRVDSINVIESNVDRVTVIVTVVMDDGIYRSEHIHLLLVEGKWLVDDWQRGA
ncbi:MAG: hypothetical protein KAH05_00835, partial [Clostridiales bacterium]|nr:hypothetical protein [Clostridiales bacterium]